MRQGRNQRAAAWALAAIALLAWPMLAHATLREAVSTTSNPAATHVSRTDAARSKRASNALRQFTGTVSAIDNQSITVEKGGKSPETRVFTKLDDMSTTGKVEKDARVTVYFREQDGKAIAHRVVVKPARGSARPRSQG